MRLWENIPHRRRLLAGAGLVFGLFFFFSLSWPEGDPNDWPSWGAYDPLKLLRSKPAPPEKWTFAVYGDTGAAEFHRNWGVPGLCKLDPALIVNTGDAMEHGGGIWTRNVDWIRWELESRALRDSIPFFPVVGDHELLVREPRTADHELHYTGARHFSMFYRLPSDSGRQNYYAFEYGGVTFIMLADLDGSLFPGSPQWLWLERTLAGAATPHIVTFSHRDIYTVGDEKDCTWKHATEFAALLKQYGVRLHFSGHDRIYYRTERDGVAYVISAGGGAEMEPLDNLRNAVPGDEHFTGNRKLDRENYHYYIACEVNGDSIIAKTVSFKTGKVFDVFTVAASRKSEPEQSE